MTNCGRCHKCFDPVRYVLDGEEFCERCGRYQRPRSHGWPAGYDIDDGTCPLPPTPSEQPSLPLEVES